MTEPRAENRSYVKPRPRLLDLFCGAGGAAMGYHRAGFDVVGVDIDPQPRYPFEFHQGDALTWPLDGYDAIHASPPCHDHSSASSSDDGTGWMLDATIERLRPLTVPWVVENVVGPTVTMGGWWFVLCGSSFGLRVRRHRRFRSKALLLPPQCRPPRAGDTARRLRQRRAGQEHPPVRWWWHESGPPPVRRADGHAMGHTGRDRPGHPARLHRVDRRPVDRRSAMTADNHHSVNQELVPMVLVGAGPDGGWPDPERYAAMYAKHRAHFDLMDRATSEAVRIMRDHYPDVGVRQMTYQIVDDIAVVVLVYDQRDAPTAVKFETP